MTISVFGIPFAGCSASFSAGSGNTNTAKTTNTASSPAAKTNSNSAAKTDKPKTALQNEKKPDGASKTAKKDNPVPADWIYIYDEAKGYGFSVPAGTTGGQDSSDGVDAFVASTPAPSELGVVVLSFKDKEMSKDDLLNVAVKFLEGMGETVTAGKLTAESEDYAFADATTTADGKKGKAKILVGTDVSDNYVMIVGADEDKFAANEKIIDEIWGSFEMWSGGSSGKN